MAEISARDLRRLEALEGRVAREEDRRKALTAERQTLRREATAAQRREREAEKRAKGLDERLEALLDENRRLAGEAEEARADLDRLRAAGEDLRARADAGAKELADLRTRLREAERALKKVEGERDRLDDRLRVAEERLGGKELTPLLPAKDVSSLLDALFDDLGSGLTGLDVREGEVRLQVAFGKVGRTAGFVVPSADTPVENLHQVTLRLNRPGQLPD